MTHNWPYSGPRLLWNPFGGNSSNQEQQQNQQTTASEGSIAVGAGANYQEQGAAQISGNVTGTDLSGSQVVGNVNFGDPNAVSTFSKTISDLFSQTESQNSAANAALISLVGPLLQAKAEQTTAEAKQTQIQTWLVPAALAGGLVWLATRKAK